MKRGRGAVDGLLPARTVLELRKLARVQKNRSNVHPHRSCGCLFHGKAPGMAAHRRSDDRPNDSAPGGQGTPRRSALNSTSSCPTGAQLRVQNVSQRADDMVAEVRALHREIGGDLFIKIPVSREGVAAIPCIVCEGM